MDKEIIARLNFKRKKNKLYYINAIGNLVEMDSSSKEKSVVLQTGIVKKPGYFYYLDKEGNIRKFKPRNL